MGVGFTDDLKKKYEVLAKKYAFELICPATVDEAKDMLPKITHLVGVLVSRGPTHTNDVTEWQIFFRQKEIDVTVLGQGQDTEKFMNLFLSMKLPKHLNELSTFSANYIFPKLIPGTNFKFYPSVLSETNFEWVYFCDIFWGEFTGKVLIYTNPASIRTKCQQLFLAADDEKLSSILRETANQFLGIVGFNLQKSGSFSRVGLPAGVLRSAFVPSKIYIPSASIADQFSLFLLKFGMVNLNGKQKFEIKNSSFTAPSSDVEFL